MVLPDQTRDRIGTALKLGYPALIAAVVALLAFLHPAATAAKPIFGLASLYAAGYSVWLAWGLTPGGGFDIERDETGELLVRETSSRRL